MKKMNKSEYQDDQKLRAEYQKVLISKAMREIRDKEADSLLESSPEDQRYLEFLETSREKRMKKMMRRLRWISLKKQFFTVAPRTMRFAVAALGILCIGLRLRRVKPFECACFRCSRKIMGNIPRLVCEKMSKKPLMFLMDGKECTIPRIFQMGSRL